VKDRDSVCISESKVST